MHTAYVALFGPLGLGFALRGRRLFLLATIPALWALGAAPSWMSLAGCALVLGTLAFDLNAHRNPKAWGALLDALPPLGAVAGLVPLLGLHGLAALCCTLPSYLIVAAWLRSSVGVPRVDRAQLVAEVERYAAAQHASGAPCHRITMAAARPLTHTERGIFFWRINDASSQGARDLHMAFPVRVDRAFEATETAQDHHTVLWRGPSTAHERLAWAGRMAELTA